MFTLELLMSIEHTENKSGLDMYTFWYFHMYVIKTLGAAYVNMSHN